MACSCRHMLLCVIALIAVIVHKARRFSSSAAVKGIRLIVSVSPAALQKEKKSISLRTELEVEAPNKKYRILAFF